MISADKGYKTIEAMHKNYHPYLSKHGCISMTVNFHALELYFKGLGGKAIHSIYEHENVNMSLFLLSQSSHDFIETTMDYNEIIESIGPDDFYIIKKAVAPLNKSFTTKELLTFLRFTVWEQYFPIGEEGDLIYCLGSIFGYFGYDSDALKLF